MKPILCSFIFFCAVNALAAQHLGIYEHGTVVRMRTGNCMAPTHGFMATIGGPPVQMGAEACPEYTLVSDKVVYVIVGSESSQLIPLADVIDYRVHKRELAVRLDDARHEIKFAIKEMVLRSEWDLIQKHLTNQLEAGPRVENGVLTTRNSD